MTQTVAVKDASLLKGNTLYSNPNTQKDLDEVAAHDKAIQEAQDQGTKDTATEQQPVHDWEKRYKDLQSYNSRKINELNGQIKQLQVQGVPKIEAPRTPEELEAFKVANPDTYAVIETMAAQIAQSQMTGYDQKLADVNGELLNTKIERAALALKEAHPDYETITASTAFHEWANVQTPEVQDWIYNNPDEPAKAIRAISLYKYDTNKSPTNVQHVQPAGADEDVNTRNRATSADLTDRNHPAFIWKESDISKMRSPEFAKWEETIMLAHREGRVLLGQ